MHCLALSLFAVAALAPAAPVPKEKKAEPYPFAVGTKWEYIHNGDEKRVCTEEITKSDEKDGVRTIRVDIKLPGGRKTHEEFEIKDGEVWCVVSSGEKCDPPMLMWKSGAKQGDTWAIDCMIGRQQIKVTVEVGKAEELDTPAGKFTATPITHSVTLPKDSQSHTAWFVEGVGLIRHRFENDESPYQELKAFTFGKK